MRNLSLRTRLIAAMALVAVVLIVVSVVITTTIGARLMDQVDSRLVAAAPTARGPFDPDDRPSRPPDGAENRPFGERVSDLYQGMLTEDGELITFFTPNLGGDEYPPPDLSGVDVDGDTSQFVTVETGDVTYRVLLQPADDYVSVTAIPIDDVESTIRQLVWVEVVGALAILAALGLVSWWVVHLGIRPVKEMTVVAGRVASGELGDRIPVTSPGTESAELAVALNTMLERIQAALDERAELEARLRRFVADASHELRTPITTIRGYAELHRHGGLQHPAALDDAMRRTEAESARLGRLVEEMLTLARLDEERPLEQREIDLAQLVNDAATDARAVAPERPIDVTIEDALGDTTIVADEDRIRQAIGNVVANALLHTEATAAVHLRLRADGDELIVEVADEGAGMPADVAARATERFFRADPARSRQRGGSGLGLAIVDACVRAHGGTVAIATGDGAGTTVSLRFPVTAADRSYAELVNSVRRADAQSSRQRSEVGDRRLALPRQSVANR